MSKYCPWADACEEALNAEAEIERLLQERKNCPSASDSEYVRRLEDEIERLRDELNRWHENAKTAPAKDQR